ncbi:MAG TPA: HAMP domain-containing sensor histidine kinase [Limnobacter sp.]|nr:HAMP domain-containing sensor histidine kinase [Limnobacter sp.]
MRQLIKLGVLIQQHYDACLLASMCLFPLLVVTAGPNLAAQAQMLYFSFVSGIILHAKVSCTRASRMPPTEKLWMLVFAASFGAWVISLTWRQFAFTALCAVAPFVLLAVMYERQHRYQMARIRIQKRRAQQSRWRVAKRAVLSEWKDRLRWLAGVQHDMRQPLHALGLLVGHPSLEPHLTQGKTHQVIRQMTSCQRWLHDLAENMLEATRLELGEQREQRIETLSSTELCKSIEGWMGQLAESKGLGFDVDVEECQIHTDARRLKRVIGNLVFNAVEHTLEGGVQFSYRRHGGVHRFTVTDSGPGLQDDFLKKSPSTSSDFGSDLPKTGIGLYVVKRLCQEMEWNLAMCNLPEGGTSFTLELADRLKPTRVGGLSTKILEKVI